MLKIVILSVDKVCEKSCRILYVVNAVHLKKFLSIYSSLMLSIYKTNFPLWIGPPIKIPHISWPSVPNFSNGKENLFHSAPAINVWIDGLNPKDLAKIIIVQNFSSPLAQKLMFFQEERLAGVIGALPGENRIPAQGPAPSAIVPASKIDPLLPWAPFSTLRNSALDFPP